MPEKKSDDIRVIRIGEKLRKLRKENGYTNYITFADENGLDKSQYWRLEAGIGFNIKSLIRILDIHKVSLREFFADELFD
jgi:transcriptional regulator with XRE-family HTH domain